ncbi:hypothetical protein [Tardiphaga sp.]|jgi:hypothetical protein|uniref:hypothetical protein n=1 Tax=Tardiphaga sp. TaxID=1926292 RepID=UPI0037D9FF85
MKAWEQMDAITPPSVKERPILFSGPMVRAILEGRKTQTRRIAKTDFLKSVRPFPDAPAEMRPCNHSWPGKRVGMTCSDCHQAIISKCPYGQPGDRLWVRETWAQNQNQYSETFIDDSLVYRADGEFRAQDNGTDLPWCPSIHMPRWASRILLEVVSVRVERLQDIGQFGAVCEGYPPSTRLECGGLDHDPVDLFIEQDVLGQQWDANPWVWVVEFKRVEA